VSISLELDFGWEEMILLRRMVARSGRGKEPVVSMIAAFAFGLEGLEILGFGG